STRPVSSSRCERGSRPCQRYAHLPWGRIETMTYAVTGGGMHIFQCHLGRIWQDPPGLSGHAGLRLLGTGVAKPAGRCLLASDLSDREDTGQYINTLTVPGQQVHVLG